MRPIFCALPLLLLTAALFATPSFADDGAAPPPYSIEFLMPGEDDAPEGWKVVDADRAPDGAPTEDMLVALGEAQGLDDETFYVETIGLKQGDGVVGVAMVDVEKNVPAFRAALDGLATEKSWVVAELGSPMRLLILGGNASLHASAKDVMIEHSVYALAEMAMGRLRGAGGHKQESHQAAIAFTDLMDVLAPDSGVRHALIGIVHWYLARKAPRKKDKPQELDKAEEAQAVELFTKALADDVTYPPRKGMRVFVAGELGQSLLTLKEDKVLKAATRALEIAVKHEREGSRQFRRYGNRYNLACAYAREKRIDDAMKALEASLETLKVMPVGQWRESYKNIQSDEDMVPLRRDPRYSELMKRFVPPKPKKSPHGKTPPANPHGNPHKDPEKDPPKNPHGDPETPKNPHGQ